MRPELIKKIKALADDKRGDPATRARAQEKLVVYRRSHPHLFEAPKPQFHDVPRADPRVHGLRRNDLVYEYRVYCDLSQWDTTRNGNPTYMLFHNGYSWRIVLFKHKRGDTYGWMRINVNLDRDETEFSGRFNTITEAQRDAWDSLMTS